MFSWLRFHRALPRPLKLNSRSQFARKKENAKPKTNVRKVRHRRPHKTKVQITDEFKSNVESRLRVVLTSSLTHLLYLLSLSLSLSLCDLLVQLAQLNWPIAAGRLQIDFQKIHKQQNKNCRKIIENLDDC